MESKLYGLLGRKLGHSWSVPIHTALGCSDYRLIEKEPEEIAALLQRSDIGGLNVTMPYKRDVMAYCDVIDPVAREIGSVNCLCRREDGLLYAWNTDAAGFSWMAQRCGIDFHGKKVLVLGSGGASLTVQAVCRGEKAREVVVISRSGENTYDNLSRHADAEIIVNTTPVGMYPHAGVSPVDLAQFPQCCGVLDLIYNPRRTALLQQAEARGIPCSGGLPMLVVQAGAAEEYFFEKPIPAEKNEEILSQLHHQMGNLVLVGMPGCGKSAVGAALAALSGREAVDIDQCIERRAGCTIAQIFAAEGEEAFRKLEREEVAAAGAMAGKIIITGGGVVKDARNYGPLHQNGRIYHLTRALEALPREGRPLSQGADLAAMWKQREPLYRAFRDAVIDNSTTIEDAAAAIWRDYCEHSGD